MIRWPLIIVASAALVDCLSPTYPNGSLQCKAGHPCPSGFAYVYHHCYKSGTAAANGSVFWTSGGGGSGSGAGGTLTGSTLNLSISGSLAVRQSAAADKSNVNFSVFSAQLY